MRNEKILEKILLAIDKNKHSLYKEKDFPTWEKMNEIYEECIPFLLYIETIQNFTEIDDMDTLIHLFDEEGLNAIRDAQGWAILNVEEEINSKAAAKKAHFNRI